jgi:hypothetical protein
MELYAFLFFQLSETVVLSKQGWKYCGNLDTIIFVIDLCYELYKTWK